MTPDPPAEAVTPAAGPPRLPTIHRADVLCITPILLSSLYGIVGRPLLPLLKASHPLLLVAIRPSTTALIIVGGLVHEGRFPLILALLVPLPMYFFADPFYFWAGRRYGNDLIRLLIDRDPWWQRPVDKGERMMRRFGFWAIIICDIPLIPLPGNIVIFLAGSSGMTWTVFLIADIIGNVMAASTSLALGYAASSTTQAILDATEKYDPYLVWATFLFVGWYMVRSTVRSMKQMRDLAEKAGGDSKTPKEVTLAAATRTVQRHVGGAVTEHLHRAGGALRGPPVHGWRRLLRLRPLDVLCLGPLVGRGVYQYLGRDILTTFMASQPALVITIRASVPALLTAGALVGGGHMQPAIALLAPLPYLFVTTPFWYWAGRRYGDRLSDHIISQGRRWAPRIAQLDRVMIRFGIPIIIAASLPVSPVPAVVFYFLAGSSRLPLWRFLVADVIGLVLFTATTVGLGYWLGDAAEAMIGDITNVVGYLLLATAAIAVIVGARSISRRDRLAASAKTAT